jgi:hypothetical protein
MINQLLETANPWKNLQDEASRLAKKWQRTGLLEGLESSTDRNNMAMILENQAKGIVAEQSSTGTATIGSNSFSAEQWAGVALPLVRKVFAQLSTKEFVSVQPMNLPSGLVFYLDFKYGTNVSPFASNNSMYGTLDTLDVDANDGLYGVGRYGYSLNELTASVGPSAAAATTGSLTIADINYDSGSIGLLSTAVKLTIPTGSTGINTRFDSLAVRSFQFHSGSNTGTATIPTVSNRVSIYPEYTKITGSVFQFVIARPTNIGGGSVSGSLVYSLQPADNSRGDFEDNPANSITIPEINVELKSQAIVAKTRKLKAQWTPEFAQDLNAYHSIDAEAELTSTLSEYISAEIDLEILDMLISDARTTEKWSAVSNRVWDGNAWVVNSPGYYNTQGQWFQTLGTKVQKVSNKIHQKTLRGGANFLVCSPSVATILESIPGYAAETNGDKMDFAMGVQKVGSLNSRFRVYKNPYFTENIILMGFRGSQFLETGAVYAPYIPLMMTPLVYDPNTFTPRKGLMTRYAKKMIRPEFYGKIFVSDLATV